MLKSDSEGRDVVIDDFDWTEEEERRIRHKIDWHAVPLVTWLYMLCVSYVQPRFQMPMRARNTKHCPQNTA